MIGCGIYQDAYLYEVTEQDLLLKHQATSKYRIGNILMFADRQAIGFGREFALAEDLLSAKAYLDTKNSRSLQGCIGYGQKLESLTTRVACQDDSLLELSKQIAQRDELLRDLAESLNMQKRDNELLHLQLVKAHEQLAADQLKNNELFDDLQFISSETHAIEAALSRVMEEKCKLEQELAERITDLIELNLQNDDLRKQLDGPAASLAYTKTQNQVAHMGSVVPGSTDCAVGNSPKSPDVNVQADMANSGKQIHILHEFPAASRHSSFTGLNRLIFSLLRVFVIIAASIMVLGAASIIATAQVNDISFGTALDLIIKSLRFPAAFLSR